MKSIFFTTDFGPSSEFVGVCKVVLKKLSPKTEVIDFCHDIPSFNVELGANLLLLCVRYSSSGIHLVIVDPGVGNERKGVVIETRRGDILIGPDNGILIHASLFLGFKRAVEIENPKYMLPEISKTFHARDVFSPVAAHISNGVELEKIGNFLTLKELKKPAWKKPKFKDGKFYGKILRSEKFGNIQTNITFNLIEKLKLERGDLLKIVISEKEILVPFVETFSDVSKGELCALMDSQELLSICLNQGNAFQKLGILGGERIVLSIF
ncbi:MAG: S-adenosyl-l-methionine hydroxide adenosyltransferase family protein [Candidatus Methanofastidiosia archaeon]